MADMREKRKRSRWVGRVAGRREKRKRSRWIGRVADRREKRYAYVVVDGEFECKQLCGRFRHLWEYDIKMYLKEDRGHQLDLSSTG